TINGAGSYRFLLTATDGQVSGGGGVDKFRMKIMSGSSAGVVYDNQMSAADGADPTTALASGSIIIHTNNGNNASSMPALGERGTFGLSQNQPNPFRNGTEVHFQVPERSTVRLVVFDVAGREVMR